MLAGTDLGPRHVARSDVSGRRLRWTAPRGALPPASRSPAALRARTRSAKIVAGRSQGLGWGLRF